MHLHILVLNTIQAIYKNLQLIWSDLAEASIILKQLKHQ